MALLLSSILVNFRSLHVHVLQHLTGFKCEQYENPADHFLDVITLCEKLPSGEIQGLENIISSFMPYASLYLKSKVKLPYCSTNI